MLSQSELNRIVPKMNKHYTLDANVKSEITDAVIRDIAKHLSMLMRVKKNHTTVEILIAESKK